MKKPQPLQVICKMYVLTVVLLSLGAASSIQLGFLEGQRYTYNYQSEVITSIPHSSDKALGLRMNSQVHADFFKNTAMQITLENISFHQVTGNDQDPKQQEQTAFDDKTLKALQLPFKVVFNGGRIKELSAHNQDPEWSVNIKRGLVNLFQIAPEMKLEEEKDKQILHQLESTVMGNCPVSYVISPDKNQPDKKDRSVKLSKLINYEQCKNRPELNRNIFYSQRCDDCQQSNGYAPYLSTIGRVDHTLRSSNISGFVINRTETYEEHIFTPFSRFGEEVKSSARQVLQFKKIDAVGKALTDRTKKVNLQFTAEDPNKSARDDVQLQTQLAQQTQRLAEEMQEAVKDPGSHQAAQTFMALIQLLRKSNRDTLEKQADRMLGSHDPTERKYFLDVLSSVGTSEAFQVLKQKIQQNKISTKEQLNRVFMGLAFASSPTAEHIKTVSELCQQQREISIRRQCLLSFGALVNRVNERARLQQDMQTVAATQEHVKGIQNYLANPLTSQQDRLTAVKVLGNAGSIQSQGLLLKIIKDRSESSQIRVNSIWALRRIISQAKDKIYPSLISTFSDTNESPELRMAIFQLLLNSEPNITTLQSVTNIVRQEITNQDPGPRSNQVASYVISLLSSVASNDNPVMKKRAMQARGALRLLPKKMFGLMSYSKGVRLPYYTEKFQAGTEFEVNKMNVPESSIPRNMNARLMLNLFGYKTDAIEFGTRIENMDDTILEHLTPNVQRRKKRSLLGSALSWFTEGSSAGKAKQGSLSTYIRVFGDELKFAEISPGHLDQLADDVTDLLSGRKSRLELKDQGIVISKDKVTIEQALEKAILLNDARRMLPTLTGIPLDIQFTSSAVIKLIGAAKMNIGSSLWGLLPDISKITGDVEIKPSVHAHADVSVGIHTPYLRMGLQLSGSASASPVHKLYFLNDAGTSTVRYDIPNERRDIVNVKTATQGFVERLNPVTYERDRQQISMDLSAPHLKQLHSIFTSCQDKFGVQLCVEGQVPDIASLRLQEIPVLSAIGQTEVRVSMGASTDKTTTIDWTNNIVKNNHGTEVKVNGQISSSNTAQGRISYKGTYRKEDHRAQLKIESKVFDVRGYEDFTVNFTANHDGLKLEFGNANLQYQINASGQIQDQGKNLRLQTQWTELPEQWKTIFYNWQPQLWYALQQFAWIRRTEQKTKQVTFELQLMTPETANLTVKTPDAEAERANLALPITIERLPQSPQDIFNNLYAQCEVTNQRIKTFDGLQYQHNIAGKCPYVLVQEHNNDKESKRVELSVLIDEKTQNWTVMASIYPQYNETVKIQPDLTILIDGRERECNQTVACQLKHSGATVQKTQTSDGTTQIQISSIRLGLYVTIEGQRLQVYASPLLRSRVRGLCGDADGEQWNEFRDAQTDQVFTTLQEFTRSWQKTC